MNCAFTIVDFISMLNHFDWYLIKPLLIKISPPRIQTFNSLFQNFNQHSFPQDTNHLNKIHTVTMNTNVTGQWKQTQNIHHIHMLYDKN